MKILVAMSKYHYDPALDEQNVMFGHSVGVVSKLVYDVSKEFGEVDYMDSRERIVGKEYDLLIGFPRDFSYLTRYNKFGKTICYLNIAESKWIKNIMATEARKIGCKLSDCFCPRDYYHADHYFMLGGDFLRKQFTDAGIPSEKITDVNYGMDAIPFKARNRNEKPVFLHIATTLGLRKGFYHVYHDFMKAVGEGLDATLHCIGRIQNEKFWINLVKEAQKNPRITIHGWIICSDPRYTELIHNADFYVFPSLAEGQGGTTMEAISGGCVPIVAREAGFPHYPLGEYIRGDTSVWHKAAALPNEDWLRIVGEMQELLKTKYNNKIFKEIIRNKLKEIL